MYAVSSIVKAHSDVVVCLVRTKLSPDVTFGVVRGAEGNVITGGNFPRNTRRTVHRRGIPR